MYHSYGWTLTDEDKKKAYHDMIRIRMVEQRLTKYYLENNIRSFVHFSVGQEAVAVGVMACLRKEDRIFGSHRNHHLYLAKGGDLKKMIAEMLERETGCSKGRGGSMHMIDEDCGYMGSISILSSVVPISVGHAWAIKDTGNIVVVFLGDGASEEGGFYESLNFASTFRIPMVFVIENNHYAVQTPKDDRRPFGFKMPSVIRGLDAGYWKTNGSSFEDVYDATRNAIQSTKIASKPSVIECMVYRDMGHSGPVYDDQIGYRKYDTKEIRDCADPVLAYKKYGTPEMIDGINKEIDEAFEFALSSEKPTVDNLLRGVIHG